MVSIPASLKKVFIKLRSPYSIAARLKTTLFLAKRIVPKSNFLVGSDNDNLLPA